jgi:hypothetical protein
MRPVKAKAVGIAVVVCLCGVAALYAGVPAGAIVFLIAVYLWQKWKLESAGEA